MRNGGVRNTKPRHRGGAERASTRAGCQAQRGPGPLSGRRASGGLLSPARVSVARGLAEALGQCCKEAGGWAGGEDPLSEGAAEASSHRARSTVLSAWGTGGLEAPS